MGRVGCWIWSLSQWPVGSGKRTVFGRRRSLIVRGCRGHTALVGCVYLVSRCRPVPGTPSHLQLVRLVLVQVLCRSLRWRRADAPRRTTAVLACVSDADDQHCTNDNTQHRRVSAVTLTNLLCGSVWELRFDKASSVVVYLYMLTKILLFYCIRLWLGRI